MVGNSIRSSSSRRAKEVELTFRTIGWLSLLCCTFQVGYTFWYAYQIENTSPVASCLDDWSDEEPNAVIPTPSALPIPMQVLEEYIAQHSAEAVRLYPHGRQYFHATFGCPRQAGIQAANFINSLLLAIASNRTVVFEYGGVGAYNKKGLNTEEECQQAFVLKNWMPQMKDVFPEGAKSTATIADSKAKPENIGDIELLKYSRSWGLSRVEGEWPGIMNLLDDESSDHYTKVFGLDKSINEDERIKQLYSLGPLFVYGMLFSESFAFRQSLIDSVKQDVPEWAHDPNVFSVALHARHIYDQDDGSNVVKEMGCIETILREQNTKERCILYLVSDRAATIEALTQQTASKFNCTIATVSQHEAIQSHSKFEHGDFAGMGYYQDVVLASHANDVFIGRRRSSSAFVVMIMDFQRRMRAWETGRDYSTPLGRCGFRNYFFTRSSLN